MKRLMVVFGVLCVAVPGLLKAQVWDGGGTNSSWSTSTNWVGNIEPTNNGTANVTFTGSVQPNVLLDSSQDVRAVTGAVNDVDFVLSGETLTVQGGGVVKTGAKNLTFNNQVVAGANQSWVVEDGGLCASSNVVLNRSSLTLDSRGGSGIRIDGVISGTGGLVVTGDVSSVLTGVNTYEGGTAVNGGAVTINNDDALGTGAVSLNDGTLKTDVNVTLANNVTVEAGHGTIDTAGNSSSINGTVDGTGNLSVIGGGTLSLTADNSGFSGTTTVQNASTVGIGSNTALGTGQLVLDDGKLKTDVDVALANNVTIETGHGTIDTAGNNSSINGIIAGAGNLSVTGGGAVSLTAANGDYSGVATVNNATTVGVGTARAFGSGSVVLDDGTLKTEAELTLDNWVVLAEGNGVIDTDGNDSKLTSTVELSREAAG